MLRMVGLVLALAGASATAAPLPIEDFVRHERVSSVRISPTGEFLAVVAPRGDQDVLVIMRTSDLSIVRLNQLPDKKSVFQPRWVGPNRLMFGAIRKIGTFAQPVGLGEWYAVDADGGRPRTIVTYDTLGPTDRARQAQMGERYGMLHPMLEDDTKVLMTVTRARGIEGSGSEVVLVDTLSGRKSTQLRAPRADCGFVADAQAQVRFANCFDDDMINGELYERRGNRWELINRSADTGMRIRVSDIAPDGRVYAIADDRQRPAGFGVVNPANGEYTEIFRDPVSDVLTYVTGTDDRTVLATVSMPDGPRVTMVETEHADAQLYRSLLASFPGQMVNMLGATADGRQVVVSVQSDRNPGEFYLFNRDSGQARFLLRNREWLPEDRMGEMRPILVRARDGKELRGFLALPPGVEDPKNLPMIVNPHGGPHGIFDTWGFNWEVQMLASRGYAVLQINFRGSGGYGRAFEEAGYMEWGAKMQDDVTDATLWAIEQGIADRDRICIYGASYGAYASLMGVAKEPNLYKCAVGYVGVYDLPTMYTDGDIPQRASGVRYLERVIGRNSAVLAERSPAQQADRIRVPVFLVAGREDVRTPPKQTEIMNRALIAAGNTPEEFYIQSGEGHGFYDEANRLTLYTKMFEFFQRHIGGSVEVRQATPAETGTGIGN